MSFSVLPHDIYSRLKRTAKRYLAATDVVNTDMLNSIAYPYSINA